MKKFQVRLMMIIIVCVLITLFIQITSRASDEAKKASPTNIQDSSSVSSSDNINITKYYESPSEEHEGRERERLPDEITWGDRELNKERLNEKERETLQKADSSCVALSLVLSLLLLAVLL